MRKLIFVLSAALLALAGQVLSVTSAKASGPDLACNVQPNSNDNFTEDLCSSDQTANVYSITYLVQGGTGTYTYSWSWTPQLGVVSEGCTATSDFCTISVHHGQGDQDFIATVVLTQGGTQTTLSADAYLAAVCGNYFC